MDFKDLNKFIIKLSQDLKLDAKRIAVKACRSPELAGMHLFVDIMAPDRYHMGMVVSQQISDNVDDANYDSAYRDALGICAASLIELRKKNGYHDELIEE